MRSSRSTRTILTTRIWTIPSHHNVFFVSWLFNCQCLSYMSLVMYCTLCALSNDGTLLSICVQGIVQSSSQLISQRPSCLPMSSPILDHCTALWFHRHSYPECYSYSRLFVPKLRFSDITHLLNCCTVVNGNEISNSCSLHARVTLMRGCIK